jgi:hypothetical protein
MSDEPDMESCPVEHCTHQMPASEYMAWELHRIRHEMSLIREALSERG